MRLSLRESIGLVTIAALSVALANAVWRARSMRDELTAYRAEVGYLQPSGDDQVAASRAPLDGPLIWKFRVRVPEGKPRYRFAYSTRWPAGQAGPQWYGAIPVAAGESRVTVRILEDPRDNRWKVSAIVASAGGTQRMGTTLPPDQIEIFRGSHERLRGGIDRSTATADVGRSLRMLDERWLVGEGALLLFGDTAPKSDQIGVFGELQPDTGTL